MSLDVILSLWNFNEPIESESRFRVAVEEARTADNRDYLLELLTQVARAQGLQRKFEDAHLTLDSVQAELTGAETRPAIRYHLERGRVFNSSKDTAQAIPQFMKSLELADAANEEYLAVDAAHMLGIAAPVEERLSWNLKALDMARAASCVLAQRWRGSLLNNIGWTYHDAGEYSKALAMFEEAEDFRRANGGGQNLRIARWCVARCLRSLGRVEEALTNQKLLLSEGKGEDQPDPYVWEEMAECLLAIGQVSEAQPYFKLAYDELSKDPWFCENESVRLERLNELSS